MYECDQCHKELDYKKGYIQIEWIKYEHSKNRTFCDLKCLNEHEKS